MFSVLRRTCGIGSSDRGKDKSLEQAFLDPVERCDKYRPNHF